MAVPPFFCHRRTPRYTGNVLMQRASIKIGHDDPIFIEYRYLIIIKEYHLFGMAQESRDVRGEKVFPVAQSDHEGTFLPCCDDFIRFLFIERRKCKGAPYLTDRFPDRRLKRGPGRMLPDQMQSTSVSVS